MAVYQERLVARNNSVNDLNAQLTRFFEQHPLNNTNNVIITDQSTRWGKALLITYDDTGLYVDVYTQYPLLDGTRGFTGEVAGITPTQDTSLATKLYVDDAISENPGITDHSALENLSNDDHTQYILADGTREFNPPSTGPGFILGVNALGELITGLNAELLNGQASTDFATDDHDHDLDYAPLVHDHDQLKVTYDFSIHGGAIGTIDLGGSIPANAIIMTLTTDVVTPFTIGGGPPAKILLDRGGNSLMPATSYTSALLTGVDTRVHLSGPKISSTGSVTFTISDTALTAGKCHIIVKWVLSDS